MSAGGELINANPVVYQVVERRRNDDLDDSHPDPIDAEEVYGKNLNFK